MTHPGRTVAHEPDQRVVAWKVEPAMGTVSCWSGFEAKILRSAFRLTVHDFACHLGVSPRTVNKWEARQRGITPLPEMQAVLDTALAQADEEARQRFFQLVRAAVPAEGSVRAAPVECDALAPISSCTTVNGGVDAAGFAGTVDHRSHDSVKTVVEFTGSDMATRREFLELSLLTGTSLIAPIRQWASAIPVVSEGLSGVGSAEVDALERAVTLFRHRDASGTGGLHRKAVVGQLTAVVEALQQRHDHGSRQRLWHITAELAQLAGWMTFDAGLCAPAQRYFVFALNACDKVGSTDLAAKIVGDLAQVSNSRQNYEDSLAMVRLALGSVPRGTNALVRSELLGHVACTYSRLGSSEVANARRSAEACVEIFDEATGDSRTSWNQYMDRAEVDCLAGGAYIRLALEATQPNHARDYAQRAEDHVSRALRSRADGFSRSRLLDEIRLSKVRLAQREPVEAARLAQRALAGARTMRSSMAVSRLVDFCGEITPCYGDVSAVQEFRAALIDYVRVYAPSKEREIIA